jgi:NhaP-type Na+/H+ or K+/H+ antiporter
VGPLAEITAVVFSRILTFLLPSFTTPISFLVSLLKSADIIPTGVIPVENLLKNVSVPAPFPINTDA